MGMRAHQMGAMVDLQHCAAQFADNQLTGANMHVQQVIIKKGHRLAYLMPWMASAPCPWPAETHSRVMIPFTRAEHLGAKHHKWCHVQVVRNSNFSIYRQPSMLGKPLQESIS